MEAAFYGAFLKKNFLMPARIVASRIPPANSSSPVPMQSSRKEVCVYFSFSIIAESDEISSENKKSRSPVWGAAENS
jgi:hypothetical protein